VKIPEGLDARAAAAAMLQGMTAHYLATGAYPLKRGDTALVHAAAGGVGLLLIQIAKMRGARVFGTVSTQEKEQLARRAPQYPEDPEGDALHSDDLADRALQEVKKAGMAGEVIFSSFYPSALQRIKERDQRLWVALLYHRDWNSLREVMGGRVFSVLNLRHSFLTREKIRKILLSRGNILNDRTEMLLIWQAAHSSGASVSHRR
jgi:NADPH2:quinone reductase